jgi:two-component system chemotaxis response regulator CheB
MCSSLIDEGSATLFQALEAGAVDVILKPRLGVVDHLNEQHQHIRDIVKGAARARVSANRIRAPQPKLSADAVLPPPRAVPWRALPKA